MRTLLYCLLAAAAATAAPNTTAAKSEPAAWRFAHPDAQILAGVDFRKLAETSEGEALRAQFAATLGAPLVNQAERLLLSSVLDARGRRSDVLILTGGFELTRLRKMAMSEGARMTNFKGLEIAAPPGSTAADPHLAWIVGNGEGTIVLVGTRPAIQAAAERSKARLESLTETNKLFGRALELSSTYSVWVSCDTVPEGFGPRALDELLEMDEGIDGLDMALRVGKTADLALWIWSGKPQIPGQILTRFQAALAAKEQFLLTPWLAELTGTIEGTALALGAAIQPGKLSERITPLLAAFALPLETAHPPKQTSANQPPPASEMVDLPGIRAKVDASVLVTGLAKLNVELPKPAPPPPPKKMVVRIEGLEDGLREIPYSKP